MSEVTELRAECVDRGEHTDRASPDERTKPGEDERRKDALGFLDLELVTPLGVRRKPCERGLELAALLGSRESTNERARERRFALECLSERSTRFEPFENAVERAGREGRGVRWP